MLEPTAIDTLLPSSPTAEPEILLLPWREPTCPSAGLGVASFAPSEQWPSAPYHSWVLPITQRFEPEPVPPPLLAAPPSEFEPCPAPCGAHGAPYLTAAEINAILNQQPSHPITLFTQHGDAL